MPHSSAMTRSSMATGMREREEAQQGPRLTNRTSVRPVRNRFGSLHQIVFDLFLGKFLHRVRRSFVEISPALMDGFPGLTQNPRSVSQAYVGSLPHSLQAMGAA